MAISSRLHTQFTKGGYAAGQPPIPPMIVSLLRRPSALLPLLMSLTALTMVIVHALLFGIVPETDEGTPAHLFQLLMAAQIPFVLVFAVKWLPREPRRTVTVLALHAGAGLAAIISVLLLT